VTIPVRQPKKLLSLQNYDGSWFGRWGINYIYGTWSVLGSLESAEVGK